jgi:uncharacterized protein (UPF0179 family)
VTAWQESALCAQVDSFLFFPEKGFSAHAAKKVCAGCEVRAECLKFALDNGMEYGVWGGLGQKAINAIRRTQRRRVVACSDSTACGDKVGTEAGFTRHRRAGEPPCEPCRVANVTVSRERKNAKLERAA